LPRILDVGCGLSKFPGSIGIDANPQTSADVICDLDRGHLPFRENSFDEVRAVHLIEHVEDVITTMEEFHRVARPGGTIFLVTPHYTDISSYTDPTHRRHLSTESFHYFYPGGKHGSESWYTQKRLKELEVHVKLLRAWRLTGLELLVNHAKWFRRFWDQYLSFVIRGKVMEFKLEVVK
jgi:predicted SAM-dependent methyltransferase